MFFRLSRGGPWFWEVKVKLEVLRAWVHTQHQDADVGSWRRGCEKTEKAHLTYATALFAYHYVLISSKGH